MDNHAAHGQLQSFNRGLDRNNTRRDRSVVIQDELEASRVTDLYFGRDDISALPHPAHFPDTDTEYQRFAHSTDEGIEAGIGRDEHVTATCLSCISTEMVEGLSNKLGNFLIAI